MNSYKSQDEIYVEYIHDFRSQSDQYLVDKFNHQTNIGFVMGRQMTMMMALNDTLYERFSNSPVYVDQKRISSWREKIILIESKLYVMKKKFEILPNLKSNSVILDFRLNGNIKPDVNAILSVIKHCIDFNSLHENIHLSADATLIAYIDDVMIYRIQIQRKNTMTDSIFSEKVLQISDILSLHLSLSLVRIHDRYSILNLN